MRGDTSPIRIGTWGVEALDTTNTAEGVFGVVCVERIGGDTVISLEGRRGEKEGESKGGNYLM